MWYGYAFEAIYIVLGTVSLMSACRSEQVRVAEPRRYRRSPQQFLHQRAAHHEGVTDRVGGSEAIM